MIDGDPPNKISMCLLKRNQIKISEYAFDFFYLIFDGIPYRITYNNFKELEVARPICRVSC